MFHLLTKYLDDNICDPMAQEKIVNGNMTTKPKKNSTIMYIYIYVARASTLSTRLDSASISKPTQGSPEKPADPPLCDLQNNH